MVVLKANVNVHEANLEPPNDPIARSLPLAALASGLFVLAQGGAQARIVCDGNFQIVNGLPVSTPIAGR